MAWSSLSISAAVLTFVFCLAFGRECHCNRGELCPPPAFPDMLTAFQDTLSHSATIRNLTNSLLSSLIQSNCQYSLLTTVDWNDFNVRLCSPELDAGLLEDSDDECRLVLYQGLTKLGGGPPLQPFSASKSLSVDFRAEQEYEGEYYEETDTETDTETETDEDSETNAADNDTDDDPRKDIAMEGWLWSVSTSARSLSDPHDGLMVNPLGIAIVVGIACGILSLICGIVILIYIRRRYYSRPKYESPPEEAVCLRWMQSRFGVGGDGSPRSEELCYSTSSEERMRTNAPGHPIKRYL